MRSHSPANGSVRPTTADAASASASARASRRTPGAAVSAVFRWGVAALACAWIAWCMSVGPLIRADKSLRAYGWLNGLIFVVAFAVCLGIVCWLVRRHDLG
ncbi:MAG: DUF6020 family protein, partial [Bifidobacterium sp.]|nr:DUF6020 family protein [Bifidobacterium sp.]